MRHLSLFLATITLLLIAGDRTSAKPLAVVIHDLMAAASPVLAGSSTAVSVDATDSGPLSCAWSASGGTITGSGPAVTWQAPDSAGTFTITCRVTGPSGTASQTINVRSVSGPTQWPSTPPAGCPFPPSTLLPGILFNRFASQHFADTFYPSWGADGAL